MLVLNIFQEFAINKNIQLGDEKGLRFPSVWDWSLQHTTRDRMLFHNPLYIGKSAPCVHNGTVKTFKRTKVRPRPAGTTGLATENDSAVALKHSTGKKGKNPPLIRLL